MSTRFAVDHLYEHCLVDDEAWNDHQRIVGQERPVETGGATGRQCLRALPLQRQWYRQEIAHRAPDTAGGPFGSGRRRKPPEPTGLPVMLWSRFPTGRI